MAGRQQRSAQCGSAPHGHGSQTGELRASGENLVVPRALDAFPSGVDDGGIAERLLGAIRDISAIGWVSLRCDVFSISG